MPIFFQQEIDANTKLAIWKIEEDEDFFLRAVPLQREITHQHKRLQHLAGRYLLKHLFPDFPTSLIRIADTRKPFLEGEAYHFSISHCSDFAAVIVSSENRVGIDLEIISEKPGKIMHKFLSEKEKKMFLFPGVESAREQIASSSAAHNMLRSGIGDDSHASDATLTLLWSAKEAMFKWWGNGKVDFSEMLRLSGACAKQAGELDAVFNNETSAASFPLHYQFFPGFVLAWINTQHGIVS